MEENEFKTLLDSLKEQQEIELFKGVKVKDLTDEQLESYIGVCAADKVRVLKNENFEKTFSLKEPDIRFLNNINKEQVIFRLLASQLSVQAELARAVNDIERLLLLFISLSKELDIKEINEKLSELINQSVDFINEENKKQN